MKNLMFLEKAILKDDSEEVSRYFSEVDRQTANECMRKAGEQFGFKTMEVMGIRLAKLSDLVQIFGYSDPSGPLKLLEKYSIMTFPMGSIGRKVQFSMREFFGLEPNDGRSVFAGWDAFLVHGVHGQTEEARKIKVYLLEMETVGRVAMATDPRFELALKNHELKRLDASIRLAIRLSEMKDGIYKDMAIVDYERLTGRTMPKSAQQDIFGSKK